MTYAPGTRAEDALIRPWPRPETWRGRRAVCYDGLMLRPLFSFLAVAAAFLAPMSACASETQAALTRVVIATSTGERVFNVEVADTPEAREKGLMHRTSMPRDQGMLFDFGRTDVVEMWMKNTYIPLDMIFIRADGVIASVAQNTTPHSLSIISSQTPVRAVLELNGGLAGELGIKPGDRLVKPRFGGAASAP